MGYKYDYTELESVFEVEPPEELAAKLDRVAVFMTRCCMETDPDRDSLIVDLLNNIKVLDDLSYILRQTCKITDYGNKYDQ